MWILSNRKPEHRRGKVQLIDASPFWRKMRKSLGSKRKEMSEEHIALVTRLFGDFTEAHLALVLDAGSKEIERRVLMPGEAKPTAAEAGKVRVVPISRIFDNAAFGYRTITVERPLRDEAGELMLGMKGKQKGKPQPDPKLRDTENVPLAEDVAAYFKREVLPHAPDLPAPRPRPGEFCAYVLRCSDGSFYIGQTDNFARRLEEHEAGKATWTAPRRPVEPIHWESFPTREKAVTREKELKTGFGRDWLKRKYAKGELAAAARQAGAWIDHDKTKVGYEIPFNRHFYVFEPPRPLDAIDADLTRVTDRIKAMIEGLSA